MATRLIGTDTSDPRLPAVVIAATQGTTSSDLAPGDVLADSMAYTDEVAAEIVAGGVSFADETQTITGTATNLAVTPAGLNAALPFVDVRAHGATGDGTTDDTAAIQAAITATALGGTVWFPPGVYATTGMLTFGRVNVAMSDDDATSIVYAGSGTAVLFDAANHATVTMRVRRSTLTWDAGTDTTSLGVVVRNTAHLRASLTVTAFWRGVVLRGDNAGTVHCSFDFEGVGNNKTGLFLDIIGSGWVNQNRFAGQILFATGPSSFAGTKMIDAPDGGNGNTFVGVSLEGSVHTKTFVIGGDSNAFINCRYEANPAGSCEFTASANHNLVIGGYGHLHPEESIFLDNGASNLFLTAGGMRIYNTGSTGRGVIIEDETGIRNAIAVKSIGQTRGEITTSGKVVCYDGVGKETDPTPIVEIDGINSLRGIRFGWPGAGAGTSVGRIYAYNATYLGIIGNLGWGTDNTHDVGSSSNRPRDVWSGRDMKCGRIVQLNGATNAYIEFTTEQATEPSAGTANSCRLYIKDNGSGKTQLMARFATGAPVQVAIEP